MSMCGGEVVGRAGRREKREEGRLFFEIWQICVIRIVVVVGVLITARSYLLPLSLFI